MTEMKKQMRANKGTGSWMVDRDPDNQLLQLLFVFDNSGYRQLAASFTKTTAEDVAAMLLAEVAILAHARAVLGCDGVEKLRKTFRHPAPNSRCSVTPRPLRLP